MFYSTTPFNRNPTANRHDDCVEKSLRGSISGKWCFAKLCLTMTTLVLGFLFTSEANAQRKLAPGVLKVIQPSISGLDVHSLPMQLPGLDPEFIRQAENSPDNYLSDPERLLGQTRQIIFRRDVYQHEYSFLGLRQLKVAAFNQDGNVNNRNVWYMVYRVRNVGAFVSHERVEDPKYGHIDFEPRVNPDSINPLILSERFFGTFRLMGTVQDRETGMYSEVSYADVVSDDLTKLIQNVEDPDQPLLNKIQLAQSILEKYPEESSEGGKWGVAIWYNVDPSLDYISVKIGGLTNAYRMEVSPDKSITFKNKTLQLNYWRAGDGIDQEKDRIVYGIQMTDDPAEQMEIARRYHLPGPVIRGEILDQETLRSTLIFETDAGIDDIDFRSAVANELDTDVIPVSVAEAFANAGYSLQNGATIRTTILGAQWTITDQLDGETRTFVVKLQPEFWEKSPEGGIRFIKSLDHLWVYE